MIVFVPASWAGAKEGPFQTTIVVPSLENELMGTVNRYRAARGLRPFRVSSQLHAAAARHTSEMASHGYFAHVSPGGQPFWRRIARYYPARGYRRWSVGENLEYGQPGLGAAEVLRDWLASPGHRENVVSTRFRDAGIGVVYVASGPGIYSGLPTTIVTLDTGLRRR